MSGTDSGTWPTEAATAATLSAGGSHGIATPLTVGAAVDHFRVVRLLGEGGMGRVYLARDTNLGRLVALKVIRPDRLDPGRGALLLDEARATARFSHPHIITIHAVGEHLAQPYLALEYLDGETLRQRMVGSRLAIAEVLRYGLAIAGALAVAHAGGVVHRDLKPDNVILPLDGRLRVVDFGLAAALAPEDEPAAWSPPAGGVAGTPGYMAPEQWSGRAQGPACDVWAFGVLIFELLAGRRPFAKTGDSRPLHLRVLAGERQPLRRDDVPESVRRLIDDCLSAAPEDRPGTTELVMRLEAMLRSSSAQRWADACPFRGLLPFEEEHADLFFGRDLEIDAFLERMRHQTVLPVVGPSGNGKSSFVLAGVVPRLRERESWKVLWARPGQQPFVALAACLLAAPAPTGPPPSNATIASLAARLAATPGALNVALHSLADERGERVLLLVDQLEEVHTHVADQRHRDAFHDAVAGAADPVDAQVRVIFTLRDDFLGRIGGGANMQRALNSVTVIRPLAAQQLRDALTLPLERTGHAWQSTATVDAIVAELRDAPAGLPLMQFACRTLWERRDRASGQLQHDTFLAMGGVAGALIEHAEAVLAALASEQVRLARRILLRLVSPHGTRCVVARADVLEGLPAAATGVLDGLAAARLLSAGKAADAAGEGAVFELAHEALIHAWPRLARWIDDSRDDRLLVDELAQSAALWIRRGRRPEETWRGDALRDANRRLASFNDELPEAARDFLRAGALLDRRQRRLRRGVSIAGVTTLALVAIVAVVVAAAFARKERLATAQANQINLAAADVGRFELHLGLFDWNPSSMSAAAVDAAAFPSLSWRLHRPEPGDPGRPGAAIEARFVRTTARPTEDGRRVQQVQTRSGRVFIRVAGRGRDGRSCPPAWIPLHSLPGFAERDLPDARPLRLDVPTCAASLGGMVAIPAGPFIDGGPGEPASQHARHGRPERQLPMADFRIDRHEVSNAAWNRFAAMAAHTGFGGRGYAVGDKVANAGLPTHPVTQVDAAAAEAFCRFMGKSLPTSEQWTKAARGGLKLAEGQTNPHPRRNLPWGVQHAPGRANLGGDEDPTKGSAPVNAFADDRSPYGVIGMAGNVNEWTATAPAGRRPEDARLIRGGDWHFPSKAGLHTIFYENQRHAGFFSLSTGFRCVDGPAGAH